jgi:hypothetical protein
MRLHKKIIAIRQLQRIRDQVDNAVSFPETALADEPFARKAALFEHVHRGGVLRHDKRLNATDADFIKQI